MAWAFLDAGITACYQAERPPRRKQPEFCNSRRLCWILGDVVREPVTGAQGGTSLQVGIALSDRTKLYEPVGWPCRLVGSRQGYLPMPLLLFLSVR